MSRKGTLDREMKTTKKQRRIMWGLLLVMSVAAITANGLFYYAKTQEVEANTAAQKTLAEESNKLLATIKARKAEERKKAIAEGYEDPLTVTSACNNTVKHNNPASIDVLVNKKHCLIPESYVPSNLVSNNGVTLSAKAMPHFQAMLAAASAAGEPFSVTSSYRSYDDQVSTYAFWKATSGQSGADTYSARPGFSEHQTGFVVDVAAAGCVLDCFGTTPQYTWLQSHAADYGFIQRYYAGYEAITGYKAEEWHYRYVGVTAAKDMKQRGIKTLEEYWDIEGGNYE